MAFQYKNGYKELWDNFIDASKNGTFMLKRGYMEYHSDRFHDCSILFFEDDRLVAVMPASLHGDELRSHGGLTYGGIISNRRMTTPKMLEVFDALRSFMHERGISSLLYKCVPRVYHNYFADEDLYALTRNGATLIRRDVSTAIDLADKIGFSELRRRGVKKALKNGLEVRQSHDYNRYIELLTQVLVQQHGVRPVHNGEELRLLAERFPNVIKLFCAYQGEDMYAGVLIFDTPQCVHAQYIANSDEGRTVGALDLVMDYLINHYASGTRFFDFGISTEDGGKFLNTGLVGQKEMFGGRAVVYDFYQWNI